MTPTQARTLMHEWTASPALRVHMECVAACMLAYAQRLAPAEADRWFVCGLLHDFDYERHPNADHKSDDEHPSTGVRHLASLGVDVEILDAILSHAHYCNVPRATPMAKVLFAVDELAGFIVACSKVRPDGMASLEPKSVKKKLKDKSFAAAVSREDIAIGLAEVAPLLLGGPPPDPAAFELKHIPTCIDAIRALG
jgi:putative nucleotidyltransferase with HDIG domain